MKLLLSAQNSSADQGRNVVFLSRQDTTLTAPLPGHLVKYWLIESSTRQITGVIHDVIVGHPSMESSNVLLVDSC